MPVEVIPPPDTCLRCETRPADTRRWQDAEGEYERHFAPDRMRVPANVRHERVEANDRMERRKRCPAAHDWKAELDADGFIPAGVGAIKRGTGELAAGSAEFVGCGSPAQPGESVNSGVSGASEDGDAKTTPSLPELSAVDGGVSESRFADDGTEAEQNGTLPENSSEGEPAAVEDAPPVIP